MNKLNLIIFWLLLSPFAWGTDFYVLKQLSAKTRNVCLHAYGLDMNAEDFLGKLKKKQISEVDKLACLYPIVLERVYDRLEALEDLDPLSPWAAHAYITLAARIYNFNYLADTPNETKRSEIMSVHPDLMIHHRILRQITPYALALVYPTLRITEQNLALEARRSAARAAELTPWSATMREASGTDCYGPQDQLCVELKARALNILRLAVSELEKNENLYGYTAHYSETREASEVKTSPLIRVARDVQNSLSGQSIDYILGVKTSIDWLTIRPDLRDVVHFIEASDTDVNSPSYQFIDLKVRDCKTIHRSLFSLALEDDANSIRSALKSLNPYETILTANPSLANDPIQMIQLFDATDCNDLVSLKNELNFHGILSRFHSYQARLILLSTHDDGAHMHEEIKNQSRRFALLSDIEAVIRKIEQLPLLPSVTGSTSEKVAAAALVNYVKHLVQEE